MRKPIIAANWKMNKTTMDAVKFMQELPQVIEETDDVEVVVCPPFTALRSVATVADIDRLNIKIGAQNMHWETSGAYTGEISASMLLDLMVKYVIIGHSERRQYFCETDDIVNKKVKAALTSGLYPILCVGETLEQREANMTDEHIVNQITKALDGVDSESMTNVVIAYEPIWAIGTGLSATPEDADQVCALIRNRLAELYEATVAENTRILYGGSVNPANIVDLMQQPDIDGGLVGGASMEVGSFSDLVMGTMKVYEKAM